MSYPQKWTGLGRDDQAPTAWSRELSHRPGPRLLGLLVVRDHTPADLQRLSSPISRRIRTIQASSKVYKWHDARFLALIQATATVTTPGVPFSLRKRVLKHLRRKGSGGRLRMANFFIHLPRHRQPAVRRWHCIRRSFRSAAARTKIQHPQLPTAKHTDPDGHMQTGGDRMRISDL